MNLQNYRADYNLPDNAFILGMIGRLRPWKGQERFLRIVRDVLDEHPHTRGILVGGTPFQPNDPYVTHLYKLIKDLDLQDRVVITGHLDDIRPVLSAMDVFVHPGDPEPFGLVNIEAMAMSKPVVAFAHGALPEIIKGGETGILITPFDEQAMATEISILLRNRSLRTTMGEAGRRTVTQAFSITRTASEVNKILISVVFQDH
jgi:glycosyltransferase involved in cell wall biosynthesis